jgi:hypothetical protein
VNFMSVRTRVPVPVKIQFFVSPKKKNYNSKFLNKSTNKILYIILIKKRKKYLLINENFFIENLKS